MPLFVMTTALAILASTGSTTRPSSGPTLQELPTKVRTALAESRDGTLDFDQPGFYAVIEQLVREPRPPGHRQPATKVDDWRALAERPNDYRGQVVQLRGTVARRKAPWQLLQRPALGWLTQIELTHNDQPLACTVICTEDVSDVPVGSVIDVTGYFVLVRDYLDGKNARRPALLIATHGPAAILQTRSIGTDEPSKLPWLVASIAIGLVATWVILRRAARPRQLDLHALRATQPAQASLADDFFEWADREPQTDTTDAQETDDAS